MNNNQKAQEYEMKPNNQNLLHSVGQVWRVCRLLLNWRLRKKKSDMSETLNNAGKQNRELSCHVGMNFLWASAKEQCK